nr:TetR family transcriptional regulator [Luteibacter rhizovicinus]
MTTRKETLLEDLLGYLLREGISDLSLRPMADAIGTSARLLIFHFGTKDNLLMEVLAEMQNRLQQSFVRLSEAASRSESSEPLFRLFWDWALQEENFVHLKLLYQLHMLVIQDSATYGPYLKGNAVNWQKMIRKTLPDCHKNAPMVTLFGAVFDGLFIELMSTGDRKRTTRALDEFVLLIRSQVASAT